jgi:hypothetical protein
MRRNKLGLREEESESVTLASLAMTNMIENLARYSKLPDKK